jgi:hypothetical protein
MYGHTPEGDQVWDLHVALRDAARVGDALYAPAEEVSAHIHELTMHHEAELALTAILSLVTPPLSPNLLKQIVQTARCVWRGDPDQLVADNVDAWLAWYPGSGTPPPYPT